MSHPSVLHGSTELVGVSLRRRMSTYACHSTECYLSLLKPLELWNMAMMSWRNVAKLGLGRVTKENTHFTPFSPLITTKSNHWVSTTWFNLFKITANTFSYFFTRFRLLLDPSVFYDVHSQDISLSSYLMNTNNSTLAGWRSENNGGRFTTHIWSLAVSRPLS